MKRYCLILLSLGMIGGLVLFTRPLSAHSDLVLQIEELSKQVSEDPQDTEVLIRRGDLNEEELKKLDAIPDEEGLIGFGEAVKTRKQSGGNADVGHHSVCLMHLANVAFRTGRTIKFDPEKEVAIGDEEANRLINQPMRAPWHL